jgi:hypothetical protein
VKACVNIGFVRIAEIWRVKTAKKPCFIAVRTGEYTGFWVIDSHRAQCYTEAKNKA